MLGSLAQQSRLPDEVIISGEGERTTEVASEFPQLKLQFLSLRESSVSHKRNAGVKAAGRDVALIAFVDDDVVLEPHALQAMLAFWENAPPDLGGAGFNWVNDPPFLWPSLKASKIASWLGLYERKKGAVLRSGIHTRVGNVDKTTDVGWLPSGAVVYARKILAEDVFDEWFRDYSYLEDLELSYRIGKKYKLAVVENARFYHYHSPVGRTDPYSFGKKEVVNRLYFVSKNKELSLTLCGLALLVRMLISVLLGFSRRDAEYFKRAAGNVAGLLSVVRNGLRTVTAQR